MRKKTLGLGVAIVVAAAFVGAITSGALAFNMAGGMKGMRAVHAQSARRSVDALAGVDMTPLVAYQNASRKVAQSILPSVVRVDVISVTKVPMTRPGQDFPWGFFFGNPNAPSPQGQDKSDEDDGNNASPSGPKREYKEGALGSGFVVERDGNNVYVLTNNHVAGNASKISVAFYDGRKYPAKLIGHDERRDLALLMATVKDVDRDIVPVRLGDSDATHVGDWVMAIGNPFGFDFSVTSGIISAKGRTGGPGGNINDFIQTDASINQGNSGGPLVNISGEVIGINTWIASQSGGSIGLGFSVPINNIKNTIASLKTGKAPAYGWFGVSIMDATVLGDDYAASAGIGDAKGGLVIEVFKGSPAEKGGIKAGDYITEINGDVVAGSDRLLYLVGELAVNSTARVKLLRGGSLLELTVKVDQRKDEKSVNTGNMQGWPGLVVIPLSDDVREELKVAADVKGVSIVQVFPRSAMAVAGLSRGDVITAVNGVATASVKDFYRAMNESTGKYTFDLVRAGQKLSLGISR